MYKILMKILMKDVQEKVKKVENKTSVKSVKLGSTLESSRSLSLGVS